MKWPKTKTSQTWCAWEELQHTGDEWKDQWISHSQCIRSVIKIQILALYFKHQILLIVTGIFECTTQTMKFTFLYSSHFLDDFCLRLSDLIEPNTFLPKSLSDRERWRGSRGGGEGESEGEERGESEWQLPSRLWERERLKRLAVEDSRLSSSFALSSLTPSSFLIPMPPCPTSKEETQCGRFVGSSLWFRGTSKPWDSLLNRARLESLRLELRLSPSSLPLFFEKTGELSTLGLLSPLLEALTLLCSLLQLPTLFVLQP